MENGAEEPEPSETAAEIHESAEIEDAIATNPLKQEVHHAVEDVFHEKNAQPAEIDFPSEDDVVKEVTETDNTTSDQSGEGDSGNKEQNLEDNSDPGALSSDNASTISQAGQPQVIESTELPTPEEELSQVDKESYEFVSAPELSETSDPEDNDADSPTTNEHPKEDKVMDELAPAPDSSEATPLEDDKDVEPVKGDELLSKEESVTDKTISSTDSSAETSTIESKVAESPIPHEELAEQTLKDESGPVPESAEAIPLEDDKDVEPVKGDEQLSKEESVTDKTISITESSEETATIESEVAESPIPQEELAEETLKDESGPAPESAEATPREDDKDVEPVKGDEQLSKEESVIDKTISSTESSEETPTIESEVAESPTPNEELAEETLKDESGPAPESAGGTSVEDDKDAQPVVGEKELSKEENVATEITSRTDSSYAAPVVEENHAESPTPHEDLPKEVNLAGEIPASTESAQAGALEDENDVEPAEANQELNKMDCVAGEFLSSTEPGVASATDDKSEESPAPHEELIQEDKVTDESASPPKFAEVTAVEHDKDAEPLTADELTKEESVAEDLTSTVHSAESSAVEDKDVEPPIPHEESSKEEAVTDKLASNLESVAGTGELNSATESGEAIAIVDDTDVKSATNSDKLSEESTEDDTASTRVSSETKVDEEPSKQATAFLKGEDAEPAQIDNTVSFRDSSEATVGVGGKDIEPALVKDGDIEPPTTQEDPMKDEIEAEDPASTRQKGSTEIASDPADEPSLLHASEEESLTRDSPVEALESTVDAEVAKDHREPSKKETAVSETDLAETAEAPASIDDTEPEGVEHEDIGGTAEPPEEAVPELVPGDEAGVASSKLPDSHDSSPNASEETTSTLEPGVDTVEAGAESDLSSEISKEESAAYETPSTGEATEIEDNEPVQHEEEPSKKATSIGESEDADPALVKNGDMVPAAAKEGPSKDETEAEEPDSTRDEGSADIVSDPVDEPSLHVSEEESLTRDSPMEALESTVDAEAAKDHQGLSEKETAVGETDLAAEPAEAPASVEDPEPEGVEHQEDSGGTPEPAEEAVPELVPGDEAGAASSKPADSFPNASEEITSTLEPGVDTVEAGAERDLSSEIFNKESAAYETPSTGEATEIKDDEPVRPEEEPSKEAAAVAESEDAEPALVKDGDMVPGAAEEDPSKDETEAIERASTQEEGTAEIVRNSVDEPSLHASEEESLSRDSPMEGLEFTVDAEAAKDHQGPPEEEAAVGETDLAAEPAEAPASIEDAEPEGVERQEDSGGTPEPAEEAVPELVPGEEAGAAFSEPPDSHDSSPNASEETISTVEPGVDTVEAGVERDDSSEISKEESAAYETPATGEATEIKDDEPVQPEEEPSKEATSILESEDVEPAIVKDGDMVPAAAEEDPSKDETEAEESASTREEGSAEMVSDPLDELSLHASEEESLTRDSPMEALESTADAEAAKDHQEPSEKETAVGETDLASEPAEAPASIEDPEPEGVEHQEDSGGTPEPAEEAVPELVPGEETGATFIMPADSHQSSTPAPDETASTLGAGVDAVEAGAERDESSEIFKEESVAYETPSTGEDAEAEDDEPVRHKGEPSEEAIAVEEKESMADEKNPASVEGKDVGFATSIKEFSDGSGADETDSAEHTPAEGTESEGVVQLEKGSSETPEPETSTQPVLMREETDNIASEPVDFHAVSRNFSEAETLPEDSALESAEPVADMDLPDRGEDKEAEEVVEHDKSYRPQEVAQPESIPEKVTAGEPTDIKKLSHNLSEEQLSAMEPAGEAVEPPADISTEEKETKERPASEQAENSNLEVEFPEEKNEVFNDSGTQEDPVPVESVDEMTHTLSQVENPEIHTKEEEQIMTTDEDKLLNGAAQHEEGSVETNEQQEVPEPDVTREETVPSEAYTEAASEFGLETPEVADTADAEPLELEADGVKSETAEAKVADKDVDFKALEGVTTERRFPAGEGENGQVEEEEPETVAEPEAVSGEGRHPSAVMEEDAGEGTSEGAATDSPAMDSSMSAAIESDEQDRGLGLKATGDGTDETVEPPEIKDADNADPGIKAEEPLDLGADDLVHYSETATLVDDDYEPPVSEESSKNLDSSKEDVPGVQEAPIESADFLELAPALAKDSDEMSGPPSGQVFKGISQNQASGNGDVSDSLPSSLIEGGDELGPDENLKIAFDEDVKEIDGTNLAEGKPLFAGKVDGLDEDKEMKTRELAPEAEESVDGSGNGKSSEKVIATDVADIPKPLEELTHKDYVTEKSSPRVLSSDTQVHEGVENSDNTDQNISNEQNFKHGFVGSLKAYCVDPKAGSKEIGGLEEITEKHVVTADFPGEAVKISPVTNIDNKNTDSSPGGLSLEKQAVQTGLTQESPDSDQDIVDTTVVPNGDIGDEQENPLAKQASVSPTASSSTVAQTRYLDSGLLQDKLHIATRDPEDGEASVPLSTHTSDLTSSWVSVSPTKNATSESTSDNSRLARPADRLASGDDWKIVSEQDISPLDASTHPTKDQDLDRGSSGTKFPFSIVLWCSESMATLFGRPSR